MFTTGSDTFSLHIEPPVFLINLAIVYNKDSEWYRNSPIIFFNKYRREDNFYKSHRLLQQN